MLDDNNNNNGTLIIICCHFGRKMRGCSCGWLLLNDTTKNDDDDDDDKRKSIFRLVSFFFPSLSRRETEERVATNGEYKCELGRNEEEKDGQIYYIQYTLVK